MVKVTFCAFCIFIDMLSNQYKHNISFYHTKGTLRQNTDNSVGFDRNEWLAKPLTLYLCISRYFKLWGKFDRMYIKLRYKLVSINMNICVIDSRSLCIEVWESELVIGESCA